MRWQGAGDITHRKRAEVCERFEESQTPNEKDRLLELADARELASYWGRTRWGPNE